METNFNSSQGSTSLTSSTGGCFIIESGEETCWTLKYGKKITVANKCPQAVGADVIVKWTLMSSSGTGLFILFSVDNKCMLRGIGGGGGCKNAIVCPLCNCLAEALEYFEK